MEIIILPEADKDLQFWVSNGNKAILKKINDLTKSILETPFDGLGKPEPLKYGLAPKWSRRINKEHRYVYMITDNTLLIYSLRGHYK
ncbi:MAG: Txe/YoeB family addiction module toxin [Saprospiraceae bacterium]